MIQIRDQIFPQLILASVFVFTACKRESDKGQAPEEARVTVTTIELKKTAPARQNRRTAVAEPFREEAIGFEVSGRVAGVLNMGREVSGPVRNVEGKTVQKGEIIAHLDPTRYQQKVDSIKLRLAAENAQLESQRIDLNELATASAVLARSQYKRVLALFKRNVVTQDALDKVKTEKDIAEATLKLKEAQILSKQAQIKEIQESLRAAELDLADCVLRAPFSGRITKQHVSRGAFAQPGSAIVTLTLLDPIKLVVAVSSEDDRRLTRGEFASIYSTDLPDKSDFLIGRIKEKGQVADPKTRTFPIEIMTRNIRRPIKGAKANFDISLPIIHRYYKEGGSLYTSIRTILKEGNKTYMWVIERNQFIKGEMKARKVEVKLGKGYWTILDWNLREISGAGIKVDDQAFIVTDAMRAGQAPPVENKVREWVLRPGDMVPVSFGLGTLPKGFYVPLQAIKEMNGKNSVFIVKDGRAKEVKIEVHESFLETRRITAKELTEKAQLIVEGVHYIVDGSAVAVEKKS